MPASNAARFAWLMLGVGACVGALATAVLAWRLAAPPVPQPQSQPQAAPIPPPGSAAAPSVNESVLIVRYPCPESATDVRLRYPLAVLRAALECTERDDGPFQIDQTGDVMNEQLMMRRLEAGSDDVDVQSRPTSVEDERHLAPIRIPIDRGLLGWRICLIRAADQPEFDQIHDLDGLRHITIGQGRDWNDVPIYQANGFRVVTGAVYDGLFEMLANSRFDAFPRGVQEVFDEFDARRQALPALAIEHSLLIHYPLVRYFWVAHSDKGERLRKRLTRGLEAMVADGSLKRLFYRFMSSAIERAGFKDRRIIEIANPLLPSTVPLDRPDLWFDPRESPP
jgi:hypothetical protein